MNAKNLYLFTAGFPYGNKHEPFLETEIQYLAKSFLSITIFPLSKDHGCRSIPKNVKINDLLCNLEFSKKDKIRYILSNIPLFFSILKTEIKDKRIIRVLKNLKFLLDYFSQQGLIAKKLFRELSYSKNNIVYDYWFSNVTLALVLLKRENQSMNLFARSHRFDLYDDNWGDLGVPFRLFKLKYLDKVYCISQHGQEYFKSKTLNKFHNKIKLSYLGVNQYPQINEYKQKQHKLIVSCSRVIPIKNVLEIIDLIKEVNHSIKWVHFGSGSQSEELIKCAKILPDNITFDYKGHKDNSSIIEFYQNNFVDLFISLSSSEGLPVSMMEALSFGIPIFSTNVGGVPEIVKDGLTGFLTDFHSPIYKKQVVFLQTLNFQFNRDKIKLFFENNFSARVNYEGFIKSIIVTN